MRRKKVIGSTPWHGKPCEWFYESFRGSMKEADKRTDRYVMQGYEAVSVVHPIDNNLDNCDVEIQYRKLDKSKCRGIKKRANPMFRRKEEGLFGDW
jgi:hypothetical protein